MPDRDRRRFSCHDSHPEDARLRKIEITHWGDLGDFDPRPDITALESARVCELFAMIEKQWRLYNPADEDGFDAVHFAKTHGIGRHFTLTREQ